MINRNDECILEIIQNLHSALEKVSGEADYLACAAGEAFITAGAAIDGAFHTSANGGLIRRMGITSKDLGDTLRTIDDIGCSASSKSLGLQVGLAETLLMEGRVLSEVAASMKSNSVPKEQVDTSENLQRRIADLAFEFALSGLDLLAFSSGVQPTKISLISSEASLAYATEEPVTPGKSVNSSVAFEPDYEAADSVVRCARDLVSRKTVLLTETIAFIVTLFNLISCDKQCATCDTLTGKPFAPGAGAIGVAGLSVRRVGGFWIADQIINWPVCCCNWCWLAWEDFLSYTKTTTLTWNTAIPSTRPIGAALNAARFGLAGRIAKAPPPAPLCP